MGVTGRGLTLLLAAGIALASPLGASSWLMVVDSGVLAPERADADRLLARVATTPDIRVLTLRDVETGWLTFLATTASEAGEASLESLRQVLAERVSDGDLEIWKLGVDPQRSCQPTGSNFIAAPGFFRYALFAVTGDGDVVDRLLDRHAVLCRQRLSGSGDGYQILRGGGSETPEVIALAAAASDRAALEQAAQRVDQAMGARGRKLMRRLETNWRPLSVIEGEWQRDLGVRALHADPPPGASPPTRVAPLEPLPLPTLASATAPPAKVATVAPLPPIAPPPVEPVATPPASAGPAVESEQLAAAVHRWAEAWAAQRIDDYLDAYASIFVPPSGASRAAWAAQRRQRLGAPSSIEVDIDGLVAEIEGPERGSVEFVQRYRSDRYRDTVTKRLELVREDGDWKIVTETVLDGG